VHGETLEGPELTHTRGRHQSRRQVRLVPIGGPCHHCRVFRETTPVPYNEWSFMVVGLAACVVVAVIDISSDSLVLIPLLVLAPLIACSGGTSRGTFVVGVVAVGAAVCLGWIDDIAGSRRHWVGVATTVLGSAMAVWFARAREMREHQLAASLPIVRRADRLKAAFATGRMGEWSWDRRNGRVTWDANTAILFGVTDDNFGGTYDAWMQLVDERDRDMVESAVAAGIAQRGPFRFDHRSRWPDGSIHWIEGIGEVIVADDDEIIGAFGLAVDVDERHRDIEERIRLLELERRERERIEFLSKINDVLAVSVDLVEIVQRVTTSVIPDLGEWCSVVVAIDRRRDRPWISVAHRDPEELIWAEQIQKDHPYDPDAKWGAAAVIRSGRRELVNEIDPAVYALPGGDVLERAGLQSVITVPLVATLGTLGALQLIRCHGQPPFEPSEIELIEEIAGRLGAALNSAILFDRQARSRAALDTLQQVSGRIASVATTAKIIHAVLAYGSAGIRADGGALFLADDEGDLTVKESVGTVDEATQEVQLRVAQQSVDGASVVVTDSLPEGSRCTAVGVPLRIMNRIIGSLVFTFDGQREFAPEELSMLVSLGSRCAGALERASLYERDRDIALTFQHRLLPALPRPPEWIEMAASYRPATGMAIGGDWYQVLETGGGRLAAVVGDAVGHGLVAAAAMGQLRASIATAVATDPDPAQAIVAVDLFAAQGADTIGASVGYVLFDPDGAARYTSAGHVPAVLLPANGCGVLLEGGRRPLLGFRMPDQRGLTASFAFGPGDLVVMYTDGLIERRGETIDDGLRRLLKAVEGARHLPPQAMCNSLLEQLTAGYDPDDDIALLVIRRK
jgi:GAF domain-containing protein/PAS domain-containing protein